MSQVPSPPAPADGHWTEARRELRGWFEREAPGLTEAYVAAVEVAHGPAFDGHGRLVAHALRDLVSRLPDAVDGPLGERFEYGPVVESLLSTWAEEDLPVDAVVDEAGAMVPEPPHQTIPIRVFVQVQSLLRGHKAVDGRIRRNAQRMYRALVGEGGNDARASDLFVKRWALIGRWAAQKVHYGPERSELTRDECLQQLELFEAMLSGMVGRFFEVTRGLDEILEDANS